MKERDLNQEIDYIINSGVNTEKMYTSPFFTTRVMGQVEQIEVKPRFSLTTYILKPAFIIFLLVNIVNFYFFSGQQKSSTDRSSNIELVTTDYIYASNDFILNEDLISNSVE